MMKQNRVGVGGGVGVRLREPLPPPHPTSVATAASISRDGKRIRQHRQRDARQATAALASNYTAHDRDGAEDAA